MHPSRKAEEALEVKARETAQVYALLAVADALQNISTSIDKLNEGFISVEIVAVPEGMVR